MTKSGRMRLWASLLLGLTATAGLAAPAFANGCNGYVGYRGCCNGYVGYRGCNGYNGNGGVHWERVRVYGWHTRVVPVVNGFNGYGCNGYSGYNGFNGYNGYYNAGFLY
jgi:hypothetical protein